MNQTTKIYGYYITYSPDDGGYYGNVCNKKGKDVYQTPIFPTEWESVKNILAKYSKHKLIRIGKQ